MRNRLSNMSTSINLETNQCRHVENVAYIVRRTADGDTEVHPTALSLTLVSRRVLYTIETVWHRQGTLSKLYELHYYTVHLNDLIKYNDATSYKCSQTAVFPSASRLLK